MATLLVIGASRGIGREVVRTALGQGHTVRGLARSAGAMEIVDENFTPIAGNALDPEDMRGALEGVDAVVLALGLPKDPSFIVKKTSLFSGATEVLLPLMAEAGVKRLIAVTGFGAGQSEAKISTLEKLPFRMIFGRAYADKSKQEALIEASDLDWTIVRPGVLTNGKATGVYKVLEAPETWRNGVISRADVAGFIVRALEDQSHIRAAPVLVR